MMETPNTPLDRRWNSADRPGTADFLDDLAQDLQPVRPMKPLYVWLLTGLAALGVIGLSLLVLGMRRDVAAGQPEPFLMLANGLLLMLALACSLAVISMARPQIGNSYQGPGWALGMAAILPACGIGVMLLHDSPPLTMFWIENGLICLVSSAALSVIVAVPLIWWLRRGAPARPRLAGLLTGLAAGSFGVFAFALHCSHGDMMHIGIWHSLAVLVCGAIGRVVIPPMIRW